MFIRPPSRLLSSLSSIASFSVICHTEYLSWTKCLKSFLLKLIMNIEIRPYQPGDEERISEIRGRNMDIWGEKGICTQEELDVLKTWEVPEAISRITSMNRSMFNRSTVVAVYDGRIVGTMVAGEPGESIWKGEVEVEITGMYVDPDYQGRGIGTALAESFFEHMRETGLKRVGAIVLPENTRVIERNKGRGYVLGDEITFPITSYGPPPNKTANFRFYKMVKTLE